jgi:HAE1 family hydrophobic/amphiphilic exporter-1
MIKLSIDRPSLLVVLFSALTILGLFSYTQLNYELIPKFSAPVLVISTLYPGASPAEVENSVTRKVEDAVSGLEKITDINSTSLESFSVVVVQFKDNVNIDVALQDAQRKLDQVQNTLPDDAKTPIISKFSTDDFPIMSIGVTSTLPGTEFYDLMDIQIKTALSQLEGVAQINLLGGQQREVRVNVKKDKLEQYGLSVLQITQAIQQANLDFPTGRVKNNEQQVLIRLAGKFTSVDQLRNLAIATNMAGAPITLGEVAEVVDTEKELTTLSRLDGQPSIGMQILKQGDANAVAVSQLVRQELTKLETQYADQNLKFAVASDSSDFTLEAVDAVVHDIALAIILVSVVMLLFLHSFRNAMIVLVAIPLSLVTTFIGMYLLGYSFNLMTLLAMTLVIGILVDDSIVVLENIYRHLEMGKDRRQAALDGSREIFLAALSITLVIVVVFLPLSVLTGIVGNIMRQFAVVVAISTMLSLLVSYTITPALAARLSRLENLNNKTLGGIVFGGFERWLTRLGERYVGLLRWSLRHKAIILITTIVLFFSSFYLVIGGYIGSEFITSSDQGEFIVQLELPKDVTLEETNAVARQVEEYLFNQPEVTGIFTTIGAQSGQLGNQNSSNLAEMLVKLVKKDERGASTPLYAWQTKNELEAMLPGTKVTSAEVGFVGGGANEAPIQVIVSSVELEEAMAYADKLLDKVKNLNGTLDPKLTVEDGNPEISVNVDRERLSELGLSMAAVGITLQTAFTGNTDAKYKDGNNEYDINVVLDQFDRRDADDVANLTVMNNRGQLVKINQIAQIEPTVGPSRLERNNRNPSVKLESKVLGVPSGNIGAEIQAWVAENPPPTGVNIKYEGDLRSQAEGFGSLGLALISGIIFMYLIMVALFDSYLYPVVVLLSLPVAMVGALLALALAPATLSIFTILGIIMLMGLVAKNAILLVDFANQAKAEGHNSFDALLQAGQERLRPILMTTLSLVIGMMPIALAEGAASEWKNGLGWVLIGGLTTSMLLTLVVVPVSYLVTDNMTAFFGRLFRRRRAGQTDAAGSVPEKQLATEEVEA